MNQVIAWLLDKLKTKNPTLYLVVVTIIVGLFYTLDFLGSEGVLPGWLLSVTPFLKLILATIGLGLNSQTKQFRNKTTIIVLFFLLSGGSLFAQTGPASVPRSSLYTVRELTDIIDDNGQLVLPTSFWKKKNFSKSTTSRKSLSIDSLITAMTQLELLGGGGSSEPQTLSINGSTLSLSGGGDVQLPVSACKNYVARLFMSNNGSPFFFSSVRENNTGSTFTLTRVSTGYYQLNWNGDPNINFDENVSILTSSRTRNRNIFVNPASGNVDIYLTDNSDNLIDQGQFDICVYMCQ